MKHTVTFSVTFEVGGEPDTSMLIGAIQFGIDKANEEGFLTPDDESSEVTNSSIYHMSTRINM